MVEDNTKYLKNHKKYAGKEAEGKERRIREARRDQLLTETRVGVGAVVVTCHLFFGMR